MPLFAHPPAVEYLIVGLGNPGEGYARTRHNIGFRCLAAVARRHHLQFKQKKARARLAQGRIGGRWVMLARPYTYMNRSGSAVAALCRWLRLSPERVLVVYDDLDLPLGRIRLRPSGGAAGHRGMLSIIAALGTEEFPRLRLGIGRPADREHDPIDYVLQSFSPAEQAALAETLDRAADAVECFLGEGIEVAMDRFNRPPPPAAGAGGTKDKGRTEAGENPGP